MCFPPAPARTQLVYLGRLDQAPIDPPIRGSLRRWLGDAPGFLQTPLARPFGLAAFGHRLFICDPPSGAVVVIDYDAQDAEVVGDLGKPVAIAVDDTGAVFVADARSGRIHVLNRDLKQLRSISPPAAGGRPAAIALHGRTLFVADVAGHLVHAYDIDAGQWSSDLSSDKPLGFPAGLAAANGRLWVADALDGQLLAGELPGSSLHVVSGSVGRLRPKHIAPDDADRIVVTDAALQRIQVIDPRGRQLLEVADPVILPLPSGVCFSKELLPFYSKRLPVGFTPSGIVFVSNQAGPPGVAVFVLGGQ